MGMGTPEDTVLAWIPTKAEPETRSWVQRVYSGDDPKKQEKVSGQREERRKDKLIKDELARSPL